MIKITPYKPTTLNYRQQKQGSDKQSPPSFHGALSPSPYQPQSPRNYAIAPNITATKPQEPFMAPAWLKDPIILKSLEHLNNLEFSKDDIKYVQSQGAILPFLSGKEAVDFIKKENTRIKFSTMPSASVHAQYDWENNFIKISDLYKNTQNPAEILALAEAILHEAGHAKDNDGESSVQEEIDCLALNAVSHRAFSRKHPQAFLNADAQIIKDGVSLYAELFFDKNPQKPQLVSRIEQKYGYLPAGDLKHSPCDLALEVKDTRI